MESFGFYHGAKCKKSLLQAGKVGLELSRGQMDVILPTNLHLSALAGECTCSSSILRFCTETEEHVSAVPRDSERGLKRDQKLPHTEVQHI